LNLLSAFKNILVLAPHTDDGEFGCGATIAKLINHGCQVHYVAFSSADEVVPKEFSSDILRHEVFQATAELGVTPQQVQVLNYPVRRFNEHRQAILDDLVRMKREIDPDLVFIPSSHDCHQDHEVVHREALRAFKNTTILGYEIIWNNFTFNNQCFVHIDESELAAKISAIHCYASQMHRHYLQEDFIRSLARVRGTQVAGQYAELFEMIRWIIY
jgi:LmbE family N-acetylglucosaminyl deacetylase